MKWGPREKVFASKTCLLYFPIFLFTFRLLGVGVDCRLCVSGVL